MSMRFLFRAIAFALLSAASFSGIALARSADRPSQSATPSPAMLAAALSGTTIAAIADGDFVAGTYASGRLAPRDAGHQDLLTVLSGSDGTLHTATLPVSNSVTAAPEIMALTRDGSTAFVVERLGQRPPEGDFIRDLPAGNRLFAIDLNDKRHPVVTDTATVAAYPEALSVHPDGKRVAVVSNTAEGSFVQIVSYANKRFGIVQRFDLAALGITGNTPAPRGGVTATNVQWHPSGTVLAVNINTQNRVVFLAMSEREGRTRLEHWGNPVEVGADPFVGRFTPDGRFYLTSDWGRDFTATNLAGRVPDRRAMLSVVRLGDPATGVPHRRVATAATDVAAEGLAVSPDGTLVATVNMRGTAFPPDSPRFQRQATVSLLRLDTATGQLSKVADYPMEGVLPEGGTFDLTGDHFIATVFEGHRDATPDTGPGLEVFRVTKGAVPGLARLGRIPLPHGIHHVDIAGPANTRPTAVTIQTTKVSAAVPERVTVRGIAGHYLNHGRQTD